MSYEKAKQIVEHFHKQCMIEDKGRFQDIKFTTYAIAKKRLEQEKQ